MRINFDHFRSPALSTVSTDADEERGLLWGAGPPDSDAVTHGKFRCHNYASKEDGDHRVERDYSDKEGPLLSSHADTALLTSSRSRVLSVLGWLSGSLLVTGALLLFLVHFRGTCTSRVISSASSSFYLPPAIDHMLHPRREAIATLFTDPTWLLPAVIALGHSLNRYEPERDHVLLVTDMMAFEERQLAMLKATRWLIRVVEHIPIPATVPGHYKDVMNKLHIWNMTDYDAVALIDGDTLAVGPLGQPFDFLYVSDYVLAAVPDISYESKSPRTLMTKTNLNAGAMWAKPDATLFKELVTASRDTSKYDAHFPEQNFLSKFFDGRWLGIHVDYNLMALYLNSGREAYYNFIRPTAKLLHFAADTKPRLVCLKGRNRHCTIDHLRWVKAIRDEMGKIGATVEDFASLGYDVKALLEATASDVAALVDE